MPLPVDFLVGDAALKIGDPSRTRVQNPDWVLFYNQSARELCQKADVLRCRGVFDLSTEDAYPYPSDMTQMTGIEVTETPADPDSWRWLDESFEDEFRSEVDGHYPSATLPERYFADKTWFFVIPRCTAAIVGGARISHFKIPARISDLAVATYELPEFTQDYVIRRMVIYAKFARNRIVEADAELKQWYADVEGLTSKIDDRSNDRRSGIRQSRDRYRGMR
jgi:hypothetical protein